MLPDIVRLSLASVVVAVFTSACADTGDVSWVEEVRLSDGRVVEVRRAARSTTTQPLGQSKEYLLREARLTVLDAQGRMPITAEWVSTLRPLVLDVDRASSEFVIVALPPLCEVYDQLGRPEPIYIEYRYRGNGWQRVPLSSERIGQKSNLLVTVGLNSETGRVSLADKERRDRPYMLYEPHRSIDPQARYSCRASGPPAASAQKDPKEE